MLGAASLIAFVEIPSHPSVVNTSKASCQEPGFLVWFWSPMAKQKSYLQVLMPRENQDFSA